MRDLFPNDSGDLISRLIGFCSSLMSGLMSPERQATEANKIVFLLRRIVKGIHHRAVAVTINFPSRLWSDNNSFRVHHPLFNFRVGTVFQNKRIICHRALSGQLRRRRFIHVQRARAFDSSKFRSTFHMQPLCMLKCDSLSGKAKKSSRFKVFSRTDRRRCVINYAMVACALITCPFLRNQSKTIMH